MTRPPDPRLPRSTMNPFRGLLVRLFGTSAETTTPDPVREGELITGIVHPGGAGGGRVPPATEWTLRFTLEEWRRADGVIRATPLSIHRTVTDEELSAMMGRISSSQIVTARVRFTGEGSAELLELVDTNVPPNDPLAARAEELSRPVTHESERFGTLRLDRGLDWWEGEATWMGNTIRIAVAATDQRELNAALATAGALWDDQGGWSERIQAFAVRELLELKNESWLDEDEAPVTEAEFRERMRLESVTVHPDGGFTFWHEDGDLFWGHSIQVGGTLAEGPDYAEIAG